MGDMALLVFSFCMQAAIGMMFFMTLSHQLYKGKAFKGAAATAAGLSIVGVLASLAHLGQPLHALNSLLNLGSSWLSREVLFSGLFMGIAVLYALVQWYKSDALALSAGLRWIGSGVGLIAVFSMGKLYTTSSVPVWQGINTFVDFYATTIAVGALLFLVLSLKELQGVDKKVYGFAVLAAVILQAAVAIPYAIALGLGGSAAQASAEILSGMSVMISLKWILVLGGAVVLLWPTLQKSIKTEGQSSILIYASLGALICGQFIGRYVFYAGMVASTIGLT
ncbi:DMSO reductase anchor subunit [Desulfitobacterium dichloroeliminans LMG P-21439]|uniref:DMSO reductase anchor subunit n=1 Tax=Desulfitobacterium dichloroeliminans (strain LMG P-21439 / DCA1) TaxID=871963 RepID=L0F5T4_DESDL|nr:DmsC/YnfH family molybdoenzyme membrane anchor subunit [Desulfitobacterium dichloroeliminans]AGA68522.1 DMSO reductase anchor subunit [Desulfitobacterium dichloroeliminans LMG P-21439]